MQCNTCGYVNAVDVSFVASGHRCRRCGVVVFDGYRGDRRDDQGYEPARSGRLWLGALAIFFLLIAAAALLVPVPDSMAGEERPVAGGVIFAVLGLTALWFALPRPLTTIRLARSPLVIVFVLVALGPLIYFTTGISAGSIVWMVVAFLVGRGSRLPPARLYRRGRRLLPVVIISGVIMGAGLAGAAAIPKSSNAEILRNGKEISDELHDLAMGVANVGGFVFLLLGPYLLGIRSRAREAGAVEEEAVRVAEANRPRGLGDVLPVTDRLPGDVSATPGIFVGSDSRNLLWSPWRVPAMILGPTGAGKTTSVIIPTVLCAPGAVISTSTKLDVADATRSIRERVGPVMVFDPTGTVRTDLPLVGWTPLQGAESWSQARRMARTMVLAITTADDRNRGAYWIDPGIDLLAAGLHLTAVSGRSMGDLWSWMRQRNLSVFEPLIGALEAETPGKVDSRAEDIIAGQQRQEAAGAGRETSGYWTYVNRALAAYQTDEALEATARPPVDWGSVFARRGTVYIAASAQDQAETAPILAAFIDSAVQARYRLHASERHGQGSAPLLLALDEAANIAPLEDLPKIAAEGGGQSVTLLAVFQTIAQARNRYGAQADGFFSLFPTTMILPGVRDRDTVELVSRLFGEYLAQHMTQNYGSTAGASPSTSSGTGESLMYRPVAPFDEVATGRDGQMIVLAQGVRPEYVRMLPWFDPAWTQWRAWFEANHPVIRPAPPRPLAPPTVPPPGDAASRRSAKTDRQ